MEERARDYCLALHRAVLARSISRFLAAWWTGQRTAR